jgi:cytochrome P450
MESQVPEDGAAVHTDLDALVQSFSVYDADVQANADEVWAHMRNTCPVAWSDAFGGYWMLSRFADVRDGFMHPENLSSFPTKIPSFDRNGLPMIPIEVDPPHHTKYRTVLGGRFSLTAVTEMEPRIRALISDVLDGLAGRLEVDLVKEVADPIPLRVILDLLMDVPKADQRMLHDKFSAMYHGPAPSEEEKLARAKALNGEIADYFAALIMLRQDSDADDLISVLLRTELGGERLSIDEVIGFCMVLVPAGFETTAFTIGYAFQLFHDNPEILDALRKDRSLLPTAVEEMVRMACPIPLSGRTVTNGCTLAGHRFEVGERVALIMGSANQDDEEFPRAKEFVADRNPNRHLAFGWGIHRCLGVHVARAEIRILLEEWIDRDLPAYDIIGEPDVSLGASWGVQSLPSGFGCDRP